jgi:hypothetical protein
MTKQRPSITSTVMVLDPLIYKLGNAIETCTPFLDRVPGELSATLTLGLLQVCRHSGTIAKLTGWTTSPPVKLTTRPETTPSGNMLPLVRSTGVIPSSAMIIKSLKSSGIRNTTGASDHSPRFLAQGQAPNVSF